jgi:hypothetical protein
MGNPTLLSRSGLRVSPLTYQKNRLAMVCLISDQNCFHSRPQLAATCVMLKLPKNQGMPTLTERFRFKHG